MPPGPWPASGFEGPVVVAGNVDARDEVAEILAGLPHVLADNAVPRIGVLAPESARAAVRAQFLQHVIAGKGLTARGAELSRLVRGPTPDIVLAGVEMLAYGIDEERPGIGDVAVVDIGGATTDVYSVVTLDAERSDDGLAHEVVAPTVGQPDGRGRPRHARVGRAARVVRAEPPTRSTPPTRRSRGPRPRPPYDAMPAGPAWSSRRTGGWSSGAASTCARSRW